MRENRRPHPPLPQCPTGLTLLLALFPEMLHIRILYTRVPLATGGIECVCIELHTAVYTSGQGTVSGLVSAQLYGCMETHSRPTYGFTDTDTDMYKGDY